MERLYEIPFVEKYESAKIDRYYITKLGKVYYGNKDLEEILPIRKAGSLYINICGTEYYLPKLMLITWVGDIDLSIRCLDSLKPSSRNTSYEINNECVKVISDDVVTIKNMIFKNIPKTYSRYYISPSGLIYDKFSNRFVKHKINPDQYHIVVLCTEDSKYKNYMVYRLVYNVYVGELPDEIEIDHLKSKSKNSIFDIEPVTHNENVKRASLVNSIHDEKIIRDICCRLSDGKSCVEIANEYGIFRGDPQYKNFLSYCNRLVNKKMRVWITDDYDFTKYKKRFDK